MKTTRRHGSIGSPDSLPKISELKFFTTCIILTKDNTRQLIETLASVLSQKPKNYANQSELSHCNFCEILIIDGSQEPIAIHRLLSESSKLHRVNLAYFTIRIMREYPPLGIYSAMNLGLRHSRGEALIFMNSGDQFYDKYSLDKLTHARQSYRLAEGSWPRVVFGQALIVPSRRYLPTWLVPDSRVCNISSWLKLFAPNHQTMLVDSGWARHNPFALNSPHSADLTWIRSALNLEGTYIYLREPVSRFTLGGISSKLPDIKVLCLRLNEPSRTRLEKMAEICKFFLLPIESLYPFLMNFKSRVAGFFF